MLYTRLTDCGECADIQSLMDDIDCKLADLAGNMYNNITLMLDQPINSEAIISLLNYRRILLHKYVNPVYLSNYTINMIAAKVKLLIFKQ
jgi:hypothetical protein